jgi:hypothetical protein
LARPGDGRLVGVNAEQAAIRRIGLQDPLSVPSATDGRIDLEAARSGCEGFDYLIHHHRQVPFFHVNYRRRRARRTLEAHLVR